jgi:hypothetical protein
VQPASTCKPQVAACETAPQDPEGAFTCEAVEASKEDNGIALLWKRCSVCRSTS